MHLALQGALDLPQQFISRLITEMEEVEKERREEGWRIVSDVALLPVCCGLV